MALTVILLCLPDSLNCLNSGVTETGILTIHPRNNLKPRKSVINVVSNERWKPNRVTDEPTNKLATPLDSTNLKGWDILENARNSP